MIVRTLRPCEVAGRTVAPGLLLDLVEHEAAALIDAGAAEAAGDAAPGAAPATDDEE
jgi:hypothetical protein